MKPDMKAGDKLLCIKDFFSNTIELKLYTQDEYYTIINIRQDVCEILSNFGLPIYFNYNKTSPYYINTYFITLNEARTQKLQNINEKRR